MGAPQIIWIILAAISFSQAAFKHGEDRPPFNVTHQTIAIALTGALLWWGGFFGP